MLRAPAAHCNMDTFLEHDRYLIVRRLFKLAALTDQLRLLMRLHPNDDDFLAELNKALAEACKLRKQEVELDNYLQALLNLLQNGRGGEKTTLKHFLAFWLALNENRDWKETFLDPRIIECMSILVGVPEKPEKVTLDTESCIQKVDPASVTRGRPQDVSTYTDGSAVDKLDAALKRAGIR